MSAKYSSNQIPVERTFDNATTGDWEAWLTFFATEILSEGTGPLT